MALALDRRSEWGSTALVRPTRGVCNSETLKQTCVVNRSWPRSGSLDRVV